MLEDIADQTSDRAIGRLRLHQVRFPFPVQEPIQFLELGRGTRTVQTFQDNKTIKNLHSASIEPKKD